MQLYHKSDKKNHTVNSDCYTVQGYLVLVDISHTFKIWFQKSCKVTLSITFGRNFENLFNDGESQLIFVLISWLFCTQKYFRFS